MAPPRPHPLAVSNAARHAARALEWSWSSGWNDKPALEPEALWAIGSKGYAREDEISIRSVEDVADFRERLEVLCRSLREEARLNALGHTMAYGQITGAIRKRHALGRLWRERPGLAETGIAPPIAVLGQMRAGTTRLQRLIAADPAHAGTRFCDSHNPLPRDPDLRPLRSRAALALARIVNPWLDTLHPFGATRTDEEIGWLSAALGACAFEAQWHIPTFVAHSEAGDPAPVYREFARILRTDAGFHRNAQRPRVLKCPQFSEDAATLVAQFPDARLVVARRKPADTIASAVSMVAAQSAFQSDSRDIAAIEAEWRRKTRLRDARLDAALADCDNAVAEVGFDDLNRDWRAAIRAVYEALGMRLTAAALAAMEREARTARSDAHHAHRGQIRRFAEA
ncbi:sulfotransferase [Qipengyuania sp. MTN3-11]|uniref:sulfotransferase n=1 Tax=Qipengyuania sp. MTN3-11 TaxID=3056557 RepID=UPI0036F21AFE